MKAKKQLSLFIIFCLGWRPTLGNTEIVNFIAHDQEEIIIPQTASW
jgi:hypothetical protein